MKPTANLLSRWFAYIITAFPRAKSLMWKVFYECFSFKCRSVYRNASILQPLNYGYAPAKGNTNIELAPEDEDVRYGFQLFAMQVEQLDLTHKSVVDVSCGHGASCYFFTKYYQPARFTGVDRCHQSLKIARQKLSSVAKLELKQADCCQLPFNDNSQDIVINTEASHCYPDLAAFLNEVTRILKPGGYFAWADLIFVSKKELIESVFEACKLNIIYYTEITENVLMSLEQDSERKAAVMESVSWWANGAIRDFAGMPGTAIFNGFKNGGFQYWRALMRKPA